MSPKRLGTIFTGLAGILFAHSAQAAVIPCAGGTITQGCSFDELFGSGSFYDRIVTSSPLAFNDIYKVTLTAPGLITITLTNTPAFINFTTLTFDGLPFTVGIVGTSYLRPAGVYDLRLAGVASKTASFSGTIDLVATVPEPASWAMMIGGFAMLGGALRRRTFSATVA